MLNSEIFIRNIKLYLLSDIEMDSSVQKVYDKIYSVFKDLKMYKDYSKICFHEDYTYEHLTFFVKGKKILFMINESMSAIIVDESIIITLKMDGILSYKDIKDIIEWFFEYLYNCNFRATYSNLNNIHHKNILCKGNFEQI